MAEISGTGWELLVKRIGIHRRPNNPNQRPRTYGSYQVFIDGQKVDDLAGHMCECIGPGDNTASGSQEHLRISEGRYPLSTQFGERYHSTGFTGDSHTPMPGFLVLKTQHRTAILVHPGHPPNLYLSSIGCFNPTKPLSEDELMDFTDSRARVIALLDSLKKHDPGAFDHQSNTPITNAALVISGEPMTPVSEIPVG